VDTTFPHQTQRKTDSPTRISTLDLLVSLLCYGPIHEITCHLFIYAAPGAARTVEIEIKNLNLQVTLLVQKDVGMGTPFTPHYNPAGSSDANQQSSLAAYSQCNALHF